MRAKPALSEGRSALLRSVLSPGSVEECRNIIMQFGVREVTAAQVARVLGMMARTHSGLTDGIPLQVSAVQDGLLVFKKQELGNLQDVSFYYSIFILPKVLAYISVIPS